MSESISKNIMKFIKCLFGSLMAAAMCGCAGGPVVIDLADYGVMPDTGENSSPVMAEALRRLASELESERQVVIRLREGRYDFYPEGASSRVYYISNHDQDNPKSVAIALENLRNVTFDGNGAELVMHGRMLPLAVVDGQDCSLRDFSIDFANPHISQVTVLENDTVGGYITYSPAPWVEYEIRDSVFVAKGPGWEHVPCAGIAFDGATRHLVYRTSDIAVGVRPVEEIAPGQIRARWDDPRLLPGTVVAMRTYGRPAPGIFLDNDRNTVINNVTVHYAEGMGLLAQMSENIDLDGFNVCLRGDDDPRYFTTQADATHFSGCKGRINSTEGLYEGMMDDAINVHGTYLKIEQKVDSVTVVARYMHPQTYGFRWGEPGDTVQILSAQTMDIADSLNIVESIAPYRSDSLPGAKEFVIRLRHVLPDSVGPDRGTFGIENLTWTPQVTFADNIVRNNRARGALFSTPRKVMVENNLFDHTSGTGILLCGDCNGWFETGSCRDVTIWKNRFVNALTNMFQFTNAVISIYPEIPDLSNQKGYFHSGIVIADNVFDTFDAPLLYAKSVDGLVFENNVVRHNSDFAPFHWNRDTVLTERVVNARLR